MNLADEDVDLVGTFDNMWSYFCHSSMLTTFEFTFESICLFAETPEKESCFLSGCSL